MLETQLARQYGASARYALRPSDLLSAQGVTNDTFGTLVLDTGWWLQGML